MWEKFRSKNGITGIGAILLSVASFLAQFMLEGWKMEIAQWLSPLGIVSILLFIGGSSLIIWNFFRRELSFVEKQKIVEQRANLLKILRGLVHKRLKIVKRLQGKAIKFPLMQYWERYLKYTVPYIVTKRKPGKPLEITNALAKKGFIWNNLYYETIKLDDYQYGQTCSEYEGTLSQINDNILKKRLKILWSVEHSVGSASIYTSFSINVPKIPHSPHGLKTALFGKKLSDTTLNKALRNVEERIDFLVDGGDL